MTTAKASALPESTENGAETPALAPRVLTPEAERALAEASARRAEIDRKAAEAKPVAEVDGRKGPEAVRYGDWEVKGIASDF